MTAFTKCLYYLIVGEVILLDKESVCVETFSDNSERWREVSAELERPGWVYELNRVEFREEWQRLPLSDYIMAASQTDEGNHHAKTQAPSAWATESAHGTD